MSFSAQITEAISIGGAEYAKNNTLSGASKLEISESVADSETDKEIVCAIDVSAVKAVVICSSQDVTLETNNGSTPDDTFSLKANLPYVWYTNKYDSLLLTVDVTSIFITNASGSAATIEVYVITDPTP